VVIASSRVEGPVREGRIVEVRGADGSPPYLVQWSDTGQQALVFPGPDAHVERTPEGAPAPVPPAGVATPRHVKTWTVRVDVFEGPGETTAHAVLSAESELGLGARGTARLHPGEPDVPEIGDEVAVARALRRLADSLLEAAASDLSAVEGHTVVLPS
jgi:hypothetical protein